MLWSRRNSKPEKYSKLATNLRRPGHYVLVGFYYALIISSELKPIVKRFLFSQFYQFCGYVR
jgi:hypothetical protein